MQNQIQVSRVYDLSLRSLIQSIESFKSSPKEESLFDKFMDFSLKDNPQDLKLSSLHNSLLEYMKKYNGEIISPWFKGNLEFSVYYDPDIEVIMVSNYNLFMEAWNLRYFSFKESFKEKYEEEYFSEFYEDIFPSHLICLGIIIPLLEG